MKKYYILFPRDFANEYVLRHVEAGSKEEKEAINNGYERITKKEAVAKCQEERTRRKCDPSSSGFGSDSIYPYGYGIYLNPMADYYTKDGYVYEKI